MARPLRIEFPGTIYHVTSRGKKRKAVFSGLKLSENGKRFGIGLSGDTQVSRRMGLGEKARQTDK